MEESSSATQTAPASDSNDTSTTNETKTNNSEMQHNGQDKLSLNGTWTLWFDNPRLAPPGSDWKENLKPIISFQTMDLFWRAFNNLLPPSRLAVGSNYSIFRKGIEPAWEHPLNIEGGKFVLTLDKKKSGKLDEYWLYTILAVLGEVIDKTGDQVNGAVVSVRKNQDRIALWLKESSTPEHCILIAERWKKALEIEKIPVKFQAHKDAAKSGNSFRNEILIEV
jgi:translation initiation factor 4E